MKIHVSIEVEDLGDLDAVQEALTRLCGDEKSTKGKGGKGGKGSKGDKAEVIVDPDPLGLGDAEEKPAKITLDDIKAAVEAAIEKDEDNVELIQKIFAKHKAKKLTELKKGKFAEVLEALNEL